MESRKIEVAYLCFCVAFLFAMNSSVKYKKEYDVLIIGAGVVGILIARELSKYELKVCVAEKECDIAMGATKANSAIVHAGYDPEPGSLKALLNVRGSLLMERICHELDVPFKRNGSIVAVFNENGNAGESQAKQLEELYERGIKNGVPGLKLLEREAVRRLEPLISPDAVLALHAPTAGIASPYELAAAASENAHMNGVDIFTSCRVTGIKAGAEPQTGDGAGGRRASGLKSRFRVATTMGLISAAFIINAAGAYADEISAMAGDGYFSIRPRKGEYLLLDKNSGNKANTVIFQLPSKKGKGILVSPTVHGNLLLGPTAADIMEKDDTSVSAEGISQIRKEALRMIPSIDTGEVITSFAGIRAVPSTGDFIIEASGRVKGLINAAGIESPGLTAAPAIAEYVRDLLSDEGLELSEKEDFQPGRPHVFRFSEASDEERRQMVEKDPAYGRIICRCEKVTEGEILDAVRRCPGIPTLDAIKRRTRSGMGRCQGGFCTPRIIELLSREYGISPLELTKSGEGSPLLLSRTK